MPFKCYQGREFFKTVINAPKVWFIHIRKIKKTQNKREKVELDKYLDEQGKIGPLGNQVSIKSFTMNFE